MTITKGLPSLEDVKAKYESYAASRLKGAGMVDENAAVEVERAFQGYVTANELMLAQTPDGKSEDLLASQAREFEANLKAIQTMRPWVTQIGNDRQPRSKSIDHPLRDGDFTGSGSKSFGASPLVLGRADIEELQKAASSGSFMRKGIAVTNAPMSSVPQYVTDVFPFLRDKARIRDLIPTQYTTAPTVYYFRGLAAASAAAAVAEGADKPESSPTWESVTVAMSKLAHYGKVNDEVIEDFTAWMQVIGGEFIAGLIDAENDALINGSGVGANVTGLLATSGIQTQAFSNNNIETVAKAITKLRTGAAYTEPDTIILNPTNWETVELYRVGGSTTTDGPFLVNPLTSPALQLWGVNVVVTNRIAAGTGIVANLKSAAEVYVRQDATLEVHPGGGGEAEWKANKTLIRAEERLALTVPRPKAIVKMTSLT